jgi:hypothetical protein
MDMNAHPAVVKAKKIAGFAVDHGWKGTIESELINGPDDHVVRETILKTYRNDEVIRAVWHDNRMDHAMYWLYDYTVPLHNSSQVIKRVQSWPNLEFVLKHVPREQYSAVIDRYRNVPFDWQTASDDEIVEAVLDKEISWCARQYSDYDTKIYKAHVLPPKRGKSLAVKHFDDGRKMLNFMGRTTQRGFISDTSRSVLLETIVRVG